MNFGQAATYLGAVRNRQIKAMAMLARERWWAAPEIPNMDEAGVPGSLCCRSGTACGCRRTRPRTWSPSSTPLMVAALADPAVRQRFKDVGQDICAARAADAGGAGGAFQKAEIDRWWPIIKAANIKGSNEVQSGADAMTKALAFAAMWLAVAVAGARADAFRRSRSPS